jgi:type II secretory pathway pseudopilin PulG
MTIIGILAGLVLGTFKFTQEKSARGRAEAEIKAMEAAITAYQIENGEFPRLGDDGATDSLDAKTNGDPTSPGYKESNLHLYKQITGDLDGDLSTKPTTKQFFEFKPNQLSFSDSGKTKVNGIVDPWGAYYGYSTANAQDSSKGYNPTFDLWSTGGKTGVPATDGQKWLKNW